MDAEVLQGGNFHGKVVRIGDTVRRPTGPWTPGVHALLRHLEQKGFDGSPRVLGIDEEGREVLTFIPGQVIHPEHFDRVASDKGLTAVARVIRRFHDAVVDFNSLHRFAWADWGQAIDRPGELMCHNDLAPYNLINTPDNRWAFIDWDLAAPGTRSWDLACALLTFIPLMPVEETASSMVSHRLLLFRDAYGPGDMGPEVIDATVSRCRRAADVIKTLGDKGEPPFARLLKEGHFETWSRAAEFVEGRASRWKSILA